MSAKKLIESTHPSRIFQSIFETAIDGIFLMDAEGIILMANSAAHRLFGYDQDELIGKDIIQLVPSPYKEADEAYDPNFLKTGNKKPAGIGHEVEALRKDGSVFHARLALGETILEGQQYFSGIIQDLTDVKKIGNELMRLNHELEKMVGERTTELQDAVNRLLETNLLLNQSIEKHKAYEQALLTARDDLKK